MGALATVVIHVANQFGFTESDWLNSIKGNMRKFDTQRITGEIRRSTAECGEIILSTAVKMYVEGIIAELTKLVAGDILIQEGGEELAKNVSDTIKNYGGNLRES